MTRRVWLMCGVVALSFAVAVDAQQPPREAPPAGTARPARRPFDLTTPRPIPARDSVWIEELTWMEVRDAMRAGKTTAIIAAGSTEQNGPYVPTGKHVLVLRATLDAIARTLGSALIAPVIPFEPGGTSTTPGTLQVRPETYEALVEDEAEGLRANGFTHIVLLGDSGGNQRGLERVATKLSASWAGSATTIHFIPEYYASWEAADGAWASLGVPKTMDEGIHDDYSVNAIIATVDPAKIRFEERRGAGKASINGQTLLPLETTVANGKQLVAIRANLAAEAIRKALAAP
jgi:creatinine amidohydrolase/Fe(II)-dependent formamide hydrolase-like protein